MVWDIRNISFRKLEKTDLPLIHSWLNTPHVHEWFTEYSNNEPTLQMVVNKYLPRVNSKEPVHCYIVMYDIKPVAFIQWYMVDDYPTTKAMIPASKNMAGIDIFIGEEEYIHKGLGSLIIRQFLRHIVFKSFEVDSCIIDPEPINKIAIKAYEKAGFCYSHGSWNAKDKVEAYIMTINKESVSE